MTLPRFLSLRRSRLPESLAAPFTAALGWMLVMTAMQTVMPLYYYFVVRPGMLASNFGSTVLMLAEAIILSWALLMPYTLLHRKKILAGVWLVASLVPLTVNWLIDLACAIIYETSFSPDIAGVILASNLSEGADFLASYGGGPAAMAASLSMLLFLILGFAGWWLTRLMRRTDMICRGYCMIAALTVLLLSAVIAVAEPPQLVTKVNLRGKTATFMRLDLGHEIEPQHPELRQVSTDKPQKIVVIIGESLSRTHCSLYGYGRDTQPLLTKLRDDSSLVVFSHPTAPACHTMAALQRVVGTWDGEESRRWYECPTFIEVARLSGYPVTWLSNQAAKGIYDNPVVRIAEFCDRHRFTNGGMMGVNSGGYDEALLPLIDEAMTSSADLTVIHLMGSHISYDNRYPASFSRLREEDYPELPSLQRETIAAYDNSVLYNDFVVSSIMNRYADKDAVVIYFSDHAQDLYRSSPTYCGHTRADNPVSVEAGREIPFLVYLPHPFREAHPAIAARIKAAANRQVNTTDLIYTLMDLTGTTFAADPAAVDRSAFR